LRTISDRLLPCQRRARTARNAALFAIKSKLRKNHAALAADQEEIVPL
jgi:hypothetical protein